MSSKSHNTLYYVHDPMCSWCWGFKPVLQQLEQQLAEVMHIKYLLGGLAADSQQAMPDDMQAFLQQTWRSIQVKIPGTQFNFNFWKVCQSRRSTYAACRAVIAARKQHADSEKLMINAIQVAYYLNARNPSDDNILIELATEIDLDINEFEKDLNSGQTQEILKHEIQMSEQLGAQGFPSLILDNDKVKTLIRLDYNHVSVNVQQVLNLI